MKQVSEHVLDLLRHTDTCTVSNAIETFNVRMRNEGFLHGANRCMFPHLPPIAGYAATGRIRTSAPPIANVCYYHRLDWWEYVASLPSPRIMVLLDADTIPGTGAFVGEIHAHIARCFGCVAYVTNGTVRDLPSVEKTGFQCYASGASVSHSYAHIVDFGEPVTIGGWKISAGDLLHGDCHGVQTIPWEIAESLPKAVRSILNRESELIAMCQSPDFSLEKLASAIKQDSLSCQPPHRH